MARCSAIKPNGERCKRLVADGSDVCSAHDPGRAAARQRAAAKGGRSRGAAGELRELKEEVRDVIARLDAGGLERGVGAVVLQGFNTLARYVELERKIVEQEEILERLERLEAQEAASAWGA